MGDDKDTGKTNAPRLSLKLKSRHHSLERQSSARDLAVSEHRQDTDSANAISSQSDEIDDHFKEVLRRLVHRLIDSENAFYALGDRIKKLEQSALDNTCPKGLAIKPVKATGKNAGPLQQDFDAILKDAQKRILQAVIKDLQTQETETSELCQENRDKIEQSLTEWRQKFRCADETFLPEADKQLMKARKFVDNFYFQCASLRASKELQESLKREAKAKRAETQMEQDFTPTEQNITNIVRRELSAVESKRKKKSRKPVTNQKALASPKTGRKQRSKSKERGNSTTRQPNSRSQSRDRSRTQPRGRSRNRRDSRNSVSFNEPKRLQASKNSKRRGSGPVK